MSSDPVQQVPASPPDLAVRVDNVSKHYLMFERPEHRLKQMIVPRVQRAMGRPPHQYYQDFAALNGVSLEVKRGETVGIIGRNGSGKSTLLQIVCGTLQPSSGSVTVNGRIAALLELGAGFNPEFTGRENVYLNAAILGLSRSEVDARFDDIARFADIGAFIDQPVKTYSSGMYVRLAFAVAINVEPDILVIDEALAVGDEAFQRKCFARIEDIRDEGGTILFVSHGAQTIVQLCDRAMLFDRGELILEGQPKAVVSQYQRFVNLVGDEVEPVRDRIKAMNAQLSVGSKHADLQGRTDTPTPKPTSDGRLEDDESWFDPNLSSPSKVEYESRGASIRDVEIVTQDGRRVNNLLSGGKYIYQYVVDFSKDVENVGFGMMIKTPQGFGLGGGATDFTPTLRLQRAEAGTCYQVRFELVWHLNPGTYFLNAGVTGTSAGNHNYTHRLLDALAFRILPLDHSIPTGLVNFQPTAQYTRVNAPVTQN